MTGMLSRKDVIKQRTLVEISITGFGVHTEQTLGELQHIIRIARFGSFTFFGVTLAIFFRGEMLTPAVSSE